MYFVTRILTLFAVFIASTSVVGTLAQESTWNDLLQKADSGEQPLAEVIVNQPQDATIQQMADVQAIVDWLNNIELAQVASTETKVATLDSLMELLSSIPVESYDALGFRAIGMPALDRLVAQSLTLTKDEFAKVESISMLALRLTMVSGSPQSRQHGLAAAENSVLNGSAYWPTIIYNLDEKSEFLQEFRARVRKGIPIGEVAVVLAESDSDLLFDGSEGTHVLDNPEGIKLLRSWLAQDCDPELVACGAPRQAAVSLAFIKDNSWAELVIVARNHADVNVVLEAAWAGARRQDESSVIQLIELAKDVRYSEKAVSYLNELQLEDRIPEEVKQPKFMARSELAYWLSHPSEKRRPPDSIEIMDQRNLKWPLEDEKVDVYLLRFTYRDPTGKEPDQTDIGMVGPMTFCHFDMRMNGRKPEDIYAIHVYRELEAYDLIESVNLQAEPASFDYMLRTWRGEALTDPKIVAVARLQPAVDYPRRLLAVASATQNGTEGYAVLDGPRSKWYPKKEQPAEAPVEAVLMIHLGRQLLGF